MIRLLIFLLAAGFGDKRNPSIWLLSPLNTEFRVQYTGFAFRFEHRKYNRGRNRLPKLVQTIAPSVPLPVFKSEGEPGTPL